MFLLRMAACTLGFCLLAGCGGRGNLYEMPEKADPYASVEPGMSEARVVQILGKPTKRQELVGDPQHLFGGRQIVCTWQKGHSTIQVSFVGDKVYQKIKK